MQLNELINSLNSLVFLIHDEKDERIKRMAVIKFNNDIFNAEDVIVDDEIENIIISLAMDMEYYEPNPKSRKEEPAFFGDERLINELENALDKIKKLRTQK